MQNISSTKIVGYYEGYRGVFSDKPRIALSDKDIMKGSDDLATALRFDAAAHHAVDPQNLTTDQMTAYLSYVDATYGDRNGKFSTHDIIQYAHAKSAKSIDVQSIYQYALENHVFLTVDGEIAKCNENPETKDLPEKEKLA